MEFKCGDKVLYKVGFMNVGKVFTFIHRVPIELAFRQPACVIEGEDGYRVHVSISSLVPVGSSNREMVCMLEKE